METDYKAIFSEFITLNSHVDVALTPIENGHINTTFKVAVARGNEKDEYILQKINHHVFHDPETLMQTIATVNEHLLKKDFPSELLKIVPTKKGALLYTDKRGDYWRVTEFIPHTYCVTKVENAEQAYDAACKLSEFYSYLLDLDATKIRASIPGFIDFEKRINDFKKVSSEADKNLLLSASSQIAFAKEHLHLPDEFIKNQKSGRFPLRVIHADPKISNVLFDTKTKKGRCVIDLDTLMPGTILYDFGDMVRSYTNLKEEDDPDPTKVFSKEYYDAVKKGFLSKLETKLEEIELNNLDYAGQVVVFIQGIRFLTDYLEGNQYYYTKYPEHNLDRTKNQFNLLAELLQL